MYILEHELINIHQNVAHFFLHIQVDSQNWQWWGGLFDKILQKIKNNKISQNIKI